MRIEDIEPYYFVDLEKILKMFLQLKDDEIIVCLGTEKTILISGKPNITYKIMKYKKQDDPKANIKIKNKIYILTNIYHQVFRKDYNYLIKLGYFYTPKTKQYNSTLASALFYQGNAKQFQRRKK